MVAETIRSMLRANPFRPFVLEVTTGKEHVVLHPAWVGVSPNDDEVIVYDAKGGHSVIDLILVAAPRVLPVVTVRPDDN
jgi:hypothetical protein